MGPDREGKEEGRRDEEELSLFCLRCQPPRQFPAKAASQVEALSIVKPANLLTGC